MLGPYNVRALGAKEVLSSTGTNGPHVGAPNDPSTPLLERAVLAAFKTVKASGSYQCLAFATASRFDVPDHRTFLEAIQVAFTIFVFFWSASLLYDLKRSLSTDISLHT